MSPAYLFEFDLRTWGLDRDQPVPPGDEEPPVEEPPDSPQSEPHAPVRDPEPKEPTRL